MSSGKQILTNILLSALNIKESHGINVKDLAFDNSELKIFLDNFKMSEDILNLKKPLLKKVTANIEPDSSRDEFLTEINFIIGLAEIAKKENSKLELDKEQLLKLEKLKEIISRYIQKNEFNIKYIEENGAKNNESYRRLLRLTEDDELYSADDYDVVEKIVNLITPENASSNLDKIYTFMNEANARKLKEKYTGVVKKKEPNINITLTRIEPKKEEKVEESIEEEVIEQEVIEEEKPRVLERIIEDYTPDAVEIEEIEDHTISENFFEFVNLGESKKNAVLVDAENAQKLKEIFATLGFNYDDFDDDLRKELELENINRLEKQAEYLIKQKIVLSKVVSKNTNVIVYLLTRSTKEYIEIVTRTLENRFDIKSAGGELFRIVNYATTIFGEEGSYNFVENAKLFIEYNIDINKIIDTNINFLYSNNENLKETIDYLKKYKADIKTIVENCSFAISPPFAFQEHKNLLRKNIEVLKMYGFNLIDFFNEKDSYYTVLNTTDLASKIDQLIEVGLTEYIHGNEKFAGNTLKTLIIKRNYYAYKNGLDVWNSLKIEFNRLNKAHPDNKMSYDEFLKVKKHIKESNELISEEEIGIIKSDYPIMGIVDESTRASIYSDTPLAILKRKTELIYGTQIISRQKVFRVFRALIDYGFEEKKALLYSLMHDSILEEQEYIFIKESVEEMGVDKVESQLLRSI